MTTPAFVLVTTSFPTSDDGSEAAGSFVSDLAEELAKHVPVRVVAPGRDSGCEIWRGTIEVFRYAAPERPLSTLKPWQPRDLLAIWRVLRGGQAATEAAVRAGPISHILAFWALPSGYWARRTARASGVPYSAWTLGSDIWALGRIPLVRSLLRSVLRDAAVCYSDGLQLAKDTRRIAGRDVAFLPSTRRIELEHAPPPRIAPPYRLLFLGRWHANKGVDLLLDALAMLGNDDWARIERVEIQGGGPLEQLVHERVATLARAGRPVGAGRFLAKAEAEAAIVRADVVLIPSRIESIPVVFSDAMKLNRPVVAMPVGDLTELISRHHVGYVAANVDAKAFSLAMIRMLQMSPSEFVRATKEVATQFDLEHTIVPTLLTLTHIRAEGRRRA